MQWLLRQALADHQGGRSARAEAGYREILSADPANADALHLLGVLIATRQPATGIDLIRKAIAVRPNAIFYNSLGTILAATRDTSSAVEIFERAIALSPKYAEAHANLGTALAEMGLLEQAETAQRRSIEINPAYAEGHSHLGDTLRRRGRLDESIAAQRAAIALRPELAVAHNNLGVALRESGRLQEALYEFEKAVELNKEYASAHYNLALALLARGDYQRGWQEYRWRWGLPEFTSRRRSFKQPGWDGASVKGTTILLHAEQGFGDTIQMVRFAELVVARGATVILECPRELERLLREVSGVEQVVVRGENLPDFDLHASLMELPRILEIRLETIPAKVRYIVAEPAAVATWRERLPRTDCRLRVGIVWEGNAFPDPQRTVPAEALRPLAEVEGVELVSIQKRAPAETERKLLSLTIPAGAINDFCDTAAIVANLDLVISIDTAVAHLAGAMAWPTWTLVPFCADWRWQLDGSDSPWYPTMRLFRQHRRGDWSEAVLELQNALRREAQRRQNRESR
jgi:tetratricopeptide (TPR) repeat protein